MVSFHSDPACSWPPTFRLPRVRLLDRDPLSAQADALESDALRAIALHSRLLRLAEVRSALECLGADAQGLQKTLTTMLPDQIPAGLDGGRLLLLMAHYDQDGELPSPSPMPDSLLIQLETFAETAGGRSVAPLAGAWIETSVLSPIFRRQSGCAPRGRVD